VGVRRALGDRGRRLALRRPSASAATARRPASDRAAAPYEGECDENGSQTSTFVVSTTTCDCEEPQALVSLVQGVCAQQ